MNDEMLETIEDVESDQPVNHAWRKRRIVLLLLIYSAFLGIIMCFVPEESTSLDFLIGLPFLILGIAWCFIDASERDHRIGRLTKLALVLFFVVIPQFIFLLQPLTSFYSRKHEFEADRYAAQHASVADLISALVKLYKDNAATLTPDPLHSLFYDSHPPATTRIARLQGIAS